MAISVTQRLVEGFAPEGTLIEAWARAEGGANRDLITKREIQAYAIADDDNPGKFKYSFYLDVLTDTEDPEFAGTVRYDFRISPSRETVTRYVANGAATSMDAIISLGTPSTPSIESVIASLLAGIPTVPTGGETTDVLTGDGNDGAAWTTLTSAAVGLANVQNYGIASQLEAEAGASNDKYMTPLRTKEAVLANLSGYATTSEVSSAVASLVDSSPATLDTLNELATALGDDPNFAATVTTALGGKANKAGDTFSGAVGLPNGSIGAPALFASNLNDTGIMFGATVQNAEPFAAIVVNGKQLIRFHDKTNAIDVDTDEPSVHIDASGIVRIDAQIEPERGFKAGLITNITVQEVGEGIRNSGQQAAAYIELVGTSAVLEQYTYGLWVKNSSKSTDPAFGVHAYLGGGETEVTGSGTTPGMTVGGLFFAKDSEIGSVGVWGDTTGDDNPEVMKIGVRGTSFYAPINVGGYFSLEVSNEPAVTMPALTESIALMCDNASAPSAKIFQARQAGVPVFTIAANGVTTFTNTVNGITAAMVGLGNVDNTTDLLKPISTATQDALDLKEDTANKSTDGTFAANSDTLFPSQKAAKTYIDTKVAALVDSSPETLDTLNELAAALGDDPNYATTTATLIGTKLAKASNLSDLTDAAAARTNIGFGNVDNTSDATKNAAVATLTNKTMSGAANTFSNIPQSAISGLEAAIAVAKQIYFYCASAAAQTVASGATVYGSVYEPGNNSNFNATESLREVTAYAAGDLISFAAQTSSAQSGLGDLVLTLRINGVDTACTVTIPAGSAAGTFTATGFTVALPLNARMSIKVANGAAATSAGVIHTTVILQRP